MLCFCDLPKLHVPFFRNSSLLLLSLLSYVGIIVQVLNGHPYNRKCDVYSFGICLWEIYCCDMPYPDLSFSEVTSAVVRQVNKKKRRPIPFSPLHLSDSWTLKHWKENHHPWLMMYYRTWGLRYRAAALAPWPTWWSAAGTRTRTSGRRWRRWCPCWRRSTRPRAVAWSRPTSHRDASRASVGTEAPDELDLMASLIICYRYISV